MRGVANSVITFSDPLTFTFVDTIRAMCSSISKSIVAAVLVTAIHSSSLAQNWPICASDLDNLRRRAGDAETAAQDAAQKQQRFKSAEYQLQQCRQFPEIYDLMQDRCQSKAYDLDSARSWYQSSLQSLRSSLDDIDSKVKSAASSCSFDFRSILGPPPSVPEGIRNPEQCMVYIQYKGRLPQQTLIDTCSKRMSAEECKKCLE